MSPCCSASPRGWARRLSLRLPLRRAAKAFAAACARKAAATSSRLSLSAISLLFCLPSFCFPALRLRRLRFFLRREGRRAIRRGARGSSAERQARQIGDRRAKCSSLTPSAGRRRLGRGRQARVWRSAPRRRVWFASSAPPIGTLALRGSSAVGAAVSADALARRLSKNARGPAAIPAREPLRRVPTRQLQSLADSGRIGVQIPTFSWREAQRLRPALRCVPARFPRNARASPNTHPQAALPNAC